MSSTNHAKGPSVRPVRAVEALPNRSRRVLELVIETYIASGEPVGSRTLTRAHGLDVSPATVRNEMMDLEEARAAVTGARQATSLPVLCTLSFGKKARTMMGVSAGQAAETLAPLGVSALGANCGEGLDIIGGILQDMRSAAPGLPLIAKPNAGLPQLVNGETVYSVNPEEFAKAISGFIRLGAQIVGSCCGSNPKFIAAIADELRDDRGNRP